jgi:hypothetical protein
MVISSVVISILLKLKRYISEPEKQHRLEMVVARNGREFAAF